MAGEGFIVPIEVVTVSVEQAIQQVGLLESKVAGSLDAIKELNRELAKPRKAPAATKEEQEAQRKSAQALDEARRKIQETAFSEKKNTYEQRLKFYQDMGKDAAEFDKAFKDKGGGFQYLMEEQAKLRRYTADYEQATKIINQHIDAKAKLNAYSKAGNPAILRETKEAQTYLALLDKIYAADAKLSRRNLMSARSAMRKEADVASTLLPLKVELALRAQLEKARIMAKGPNQEMLRSIAIHEQKLVKLKTELDLATRLASVEAKQKNQSGVEALMRAEAAFKLQNTELRTELELRQKLADVAAKSKQQASVEALMRAEAAFKLQNTELRTELELRQKLADVAAKSKQQASVEALMRAEAAFKLQNTELRTELELRQKLQDAQVRASQTSQNITRKIAEQQRLLIPLKAELDLLAKIKKLEEEQKLNPADRAKLQSLQEQVKLENQLASAKAKQDLRANNPQYAQMQKDLQQLNKEEMKHAEQNKAIAAAYREVAKARAMLSGEYKAATAQLTSSERAQVAQLKLVAEWENKVAKARAMQTTQVQALVREYRHLTNHTTAAMSGEVAGLNQVTASFRAALAGIGMGFGIYTSATIMAATATYGFVAALRDTIVSGAEFQNEMARVSAAMNLTAEQYNDLSARALDLANNSRYAATEIVKAYREMAMSGFTYQETVDGINAVLKMASIGMLEFGQAADIATNVLFGFNLNATDLDHVVDVLATTITRSAQDLEQLGTAMSYIAPIASSFGLSLETAAAATEVLANAGIKSSRAGTGLRRTFTALFSDSEKVTEALAALGVTVNTAAYDMDEEFVRVLKALNVATNGATTGVGELTKAVGLYAIPAFLNLIKAAKEGEGSLESILKAYENVGGAATRMQKRMEESLKVDFEELLASLSTLKQEIFNILGPDLREGLQDITGWMRGLVESKGAITEMVTELKELGKTVLWIAGILAGTGMAGLLLSRGSNVAKAWLDRRQFKKELAARDLPTQNPVSSLVDVRGNPIASVLPAAATGATSSILSSAGVPLAAAAAAGAAGSALASTGAAVDKTTEKITKMGLASNLLAKVLKLAGPVSLFFIAKDIIDIFFALSSAAVKPTDKILKLAQAQEVLNDSMHGYKLRNSADPALSNAAFEDAAANKRALDDAEKQVKELEDRVFATSDLITKKASGVRINELQPLVDQERRLLAELESAAKARDAANDKYVRSLSQAAAGRLSDLETRKAELDVEKQVLTQQLNQMQDAVSAAKQKIDTEVKPKFWFSDMVEDDDPGLLLYINKHLPDVAALLAKYEELKTKLEGVRKNLKAVNNELDFNGQQLRQTAADTAQVTASFDISDEIKQKYISLVSSIDLVVKEKEKLIETNELENKSAEEQLEYYMRQIAAYEEAQRKVKEISGTADKPGLIMQLRAQVEELERTKDALEKLDNKGGATAVQEEIDRVNLQIKPLQDLINFVTNNKEAYIGWLEAVLDLSEGHEKLAESIDEVRHALFELFEMANDSDFPDTMAGNLEKAIKNSEGLLKKAQEIANGTWITAPAKSNGVDRNSVIERLRGETQAVQTLTGSYDTLAEKKKAIAELESRYRLPSGMLDTVWRKESGRGRTAGVDYSRLHTDESTGKPVEVVGEFQMTRDTAKGLGFGLGTWENQAEAAAVFLAKALDKYGVPEKAFKAYYGGMSGSGWGLKTAAYAADAMKKMALSPAGSVVEDYNKTEKAIAGVGDTAVKATPAVANLVTTTSSAAKGQAQILEDMNNEWDRLNELDVSMQRIADLEKSTDDLMAMRAQMRAQITELQSAGIYTEEDKARLDSLIEGEKELGARIRENRDMLVPLQEEMVMQGKLAGDAIDYTAGKLKELASGYDSAWSRSRKYYLVTAQIKKLEDAGYLTHTEAYLEKINAHLESMDPLTKQFSEEIVNTFKNIWSGSEDASEAVDNLKKSLKDLTMEKFVVNLGVSMTGKIMEPFMKMFQHTMTSYLDIGANIFTSIGSMLLNSIGGLFGGSTTGAGAGIGGVGGLSNLFSVGGLTNMFGGYTMGSGIADLFLGPGGAQAAVMDMGTTGSSFFSNSMGNLATTPNWNLSLSGIAGSLAGNLLFGNKGYGGIGSSIGGTAGSMIGAALLTPVLGPFAPLVGSLLGGVGGGFLGSLFGDEEPRYGHYMADTGGRIGNLEDWENGPENYSKGAFGLTFGISDKGSKNFDASEMKSTFDALAAFSEELASFFGEEVSKQIEDALADWPQLWGGDDINSAFKDIFGNIIDAAGQTSDEMAQLFDVLVGTLTGTAEEAAAQIKKAMAATEGMIVTMGQMMNKEVVNALGFKGDLVTMAKDMAKYAVKFAESGETQTDAIIRVTSELAMLQNVIDQTATSIEGLNGDEIADLAHSIAEAFGSIEKALSYQAIYYEQFKSASEKATDAIKVVINKLNTELPDIRKELEKFYIEPDKLKPIIPELKEEKSAKTRLEELIKDFEKQGLSSGYAYAANYLREGGSFTVYDGYVGPSQEKMDAMADLLKEVTDKPIAHTFTIDYGSAEAYTDPANYEFQAKYPWNDTDLDKNNKENEAIRKANAESILKAVEFYTKGVASGRIEKSADTEKQLQDMMNQYADTISAMGIDVTKGLDGVAQQIKDLSKTYLTTEEEKQLQAWDPDNPDAKNARIYAELIEAIPTSREEFNDLIGQIDTTTEAGRLFYEEIMKLVEAFDAMYDSIENFERWLGVTDDEELATKRLTKIFEDMGMTLPDSKDALLKMYEAGKFTAEQLAILGASVEDLETLFGAADEVQESYDDLSNATIRELEASLSKFTEELNKSKAALEATKSAIENLRKASQTTETYMDEIRNRARAALTEQRLPDDIQEIVRGLGEVNKEDYGTSEDYMAAVYENENLLRQIQLRAQNQVNYDQKQVDLIQEQINVAKEALIAEKDNTQKLIASYQEQILELEGKLQTMWDTGLGQVVEYLATISIWIGDIKNLLTAAEGFFVNLNLQIQTHQITANSLLAQINTNSLNQLGWLQSIRNAMGSAAAVATPAYTPEAEPPELYTPTGTQERADQTRDLQLDELLWELRQLHADMKYQLSSVDTASRRTADTLTRWEGDGLPPDREEYLRQTAYNTRQRIASSPCM